jgi:CBS domain-containing protein
MDENLANILHATFFEEELGKLHNVVVRHAMVREIDTLPPDASVMQAVSLFVRHGRKTVPVVEGTRFLGSVTRRSVLRHIRKAADS